MPVPPPVTTAVLPCSLLMMCSFIEVALSWMATHLTTSMHLLVSIKNDIRSFWPTTGAHPFAGPGLHADAARFHLRPRRDVAGHRRQVEAADPLLPRPGRS